MKALPREWNLIELLFTFAILACKCNRSLKYVIVGNDWSFDAIFSDGYRLRVTWFASHESASFKCDRDCKVPYQVLRKNLEGRDSEVVRAGRACAWSSYLHVAGRVHFSRPTRKSTLGKVTAFR